MVEGQPQALREIGDGPLQQSDNVIEDVITLPLCQPTLCSWVIHTKSDDPAADNGSVNNQLPVPALRQLPVWHGE